MTIDLTHILIFKTNIATGSDKLLVEKLFAENKGVEEWHVDTEDVDCVLRIVSHELCAGQITHLLAQIGFQCEELQ